MVEYRLGRRVLHAGRCQHRLIAGPDGFRVAFKRFDLVDSEDERRGLAIIL